METLHHFRFHPNLKDNVYNVGFELCAYMENTFFKESDENAKESKKNDNHNNISEEEENNDYDDSNDDDDDDDQDQVYELMPTEECDILRDPSFSESSRSFQEKLKKTRKQMSIFNLIEQPLLI